MSQFFGRKQEIQLIQSLADSREPQILTVYGRRRVGKTELIETALRHRNTIKLEGIQGLSAYEQRKRALKQLGRYLQDVDLERLQIDSWYDFFDLLVRRVVFTQPTVLYLEELQWLANYSADLIADLKYFWDNHLRHINGFFLILCGSSPSFMLNNVVNSAALHNRSQHNLHLQPFTLTEVKLYLGERYSLLQIFDAHLTVGGIPEYLNYLKENTSVQLALCQNAFVKDAFFSKEYERIFISSLRNNPHYRKVISILANTRFATRAEILKKLGRQSGGDLSELLAELELCGFIESYAPYNNPSSKKLVRYQISDPYLQFYYKFIAPIERDISMQSFNANPVQALNTSQYDIWLGYQFERWCRSHHRIIAQLLGFSAVKYEHGSFFSRTVDKTAPGFQWDLVFDRRDRVVTLCEVKYLRTPATVKVANDFQKKLELFPDTRLKGRAVERVLIAPLGASMELQNLGYFDRVITGEELLTEDL